MLENCTVPGILRQELVRRKRPRILLGVIACFLSGATLFCGCRHDTVIVIVPLPKLEARGGEGKEPQVVRQEADRELTREDLNPIVRLLEAWIDQHSQQLAEAYYIENPRLTSKTLDGPREFHDDGKVAPWWKVGEWAIFGTRTRCKATYTYKNRFIVVYIEKTNSAYHVADHKVAII